MYKRYILPKLIAIIISLLFARNFNNKINEEYLR